MRTRTTTFRGGSGNALRPCRKSFSPLVDCLEDEIDSRTRMTTTTTGHGRGAKNRSALSFDCAFFHRRRSPGRRQLPRGPRRDSQRWLTKTSSDSRPYTHHRRSLFLRLSTAVSCPVSTTALPSPFTHSFSPFFSPPLRIRETGSSLPPPLSLPSLLPPSPPPRAGTTPHSYYVTIKSSRFSRTISYCACRVKFRDRT